MRKTLLIAATLGVFAAPAIAEDAGVRVVPGVTVGVTNGDHDRDRVRDKTVIKEREPSERTTTIKKEREDGTESKTVIHRDY